MPVLSGGPQPSDIDHALAHWHQRVVATAGVSAVEAEARAFAGALPGVAAGEGGRPAPAPDPNTVGVVFVHGVGSQKAGETLLNWSRPLIATLTAWREGPPGTGGGPVDPIVDPTAAASIDFTGSTFPSVRLDVPAPYPGDPDHPPQTWYLSEAWWASSVVPPSLRTMVDWLGPKGGLGLMVEGVIRQRPEPFRRAWRWLSNAGLSLFVSSLATLVLSGFAALRALAGLVPGLGDNVAIAALSGFLTDWFGDVHTLLRDPAQSANVRRRLAEAIVGLRELGCGSIVVVGHSAGTLVTYLTLTDPAYGGVAVDKFVSLGEALNFSWSMERTGAGAGAGPGAGAGAGGARLGDSRLFGNLLALRPGLRWVDFYASHDPAPFGPLDLLETAGQPVAVSDHDLERLRSHRVWNLRSILDDHGAYWDNEEEFIIPLLRELDTPTGGPEASRFYPVPPAPVAPRWPSPTSATVALTGRDVDRSALRHQRVALLALWRRAGFVAPFTILALAAVAGGGWLVDIGGQVARQLAALPALNFAAGFVGFLRDLSDATPLPAIDAGLVVLKLALAGLVIAAVAPTTTWEAWPQPARGLWSVIDVGAFAPVVGLFLAAGVVAATRQPDLPRGLGALVDTSGALYAGVDLALLGVARLAGGRVGLSATLLPTVILAGAVLAVLAVPRDPVLASGAAGLVLATAVLAAVVQAGTWRWTVWDARERRYVRVDLLEAMPSRRSALVEGVLLSIVLAAIVLAFGLGQALPGGVATGLWAAGAILAVVIVLGLAVDVLHDRTDAAIGPVSSLFADSESHVAS